MEIVEFTLIAFLYFLMVSYLLVMLFMKRRYFLNFDMIFIFLCIMSFVPCIINYGSKTNLFITSLYIIFIFSFIISYNTVPIRTTGYREGIEYNQKTLFFAAGSFALIGIGMLFLYLKSIGGNALLFFIVSKMERAVFTEETMGLRQLSIYRPILWVSYSVAILLYFKYKKRKYRYLYYALFSILVFSSLMNISRSQFFNLLFPILVAYSIFRKPIPLRIIVILTCTMIFISLGFKAFVRNIGPTILERQEFRFEIDRWFTDMANPEKYAFSSNYYIIKDIIEEYDNLPLSKKFGLTYVTSLFITSNPFSDMDNLSVWYVKKFHPSIYGAGGGRGFSQLAEAFMNFHFIGVIILGGFLGLLTRKLYAKAFVKKHSAYITIYFSILVIAGAFLRSDSTKLINSIFLYTILPVILIYEISDMRFLRTVFKPH